VTPPLSPMPRPTKLYEPSFSDPVFDLPVLSDPDSLTHDDLKKIEKQLFDQDIPTPIRKAKANNEEVAVSFHSVMNYKHMCHRLGHSVLHSTRHLLPVIH